MIIGEKDHWNCGIELGTLKRSPENLKRLHLSESSKLNFFFFWIQAQTSFFSYCHMWRHAEIGSEFSRLRIHTFPLRTLIIEETHTMFAQTEIEQNSVVRQQNRPWASASLVQNVQWPSSCRIPMMRWLCTQPQEIPSGEGESKSAVLLSPPPIHFVQDPGCILHPLKAQESLTLTMVSCDHNTVWNTTMVLCGGPSCLFTWTCITASVFGVRRFWAGLVKYLKQKKNNNSSLDPFFVFVVVVFCFCFCFFAAESSQHSKAGDVFIERVFQGFTVQTFLKCQTFEAQWDLWMRDFSTDDATLPPDIYNVRQTPGFLVLFCW